MHLSATTFCAMTPQVYTGTVRDAVDVPSAFCEVRVKVCVADRDMLVLAVPVATEPTPLIVSDESPVTFHESFTLPPKQRNEDGVAVKELMTGTAGAASKPTIPA